MDFYMSIGGRRFIDGTVPNLVKAMERLAKAMERQNELKEIELGVRPVLDVKAVAQEFQTKPNAG